MKDFFSKTLGGLTNEYYFRQFVFGLIITIAMTYTIPQGDFLKLKIKDILFYIIFFTINTFLYPYSRYVYESIIDFVIGNNEFFVDSKIFMVIKILTMFLCWMFAIFIAPLGLLYLYYVNNKK